MGPVGKFPISRRLFQKKMETRPTFSKRILDQMAQRIFASAANSKQMGNNQAKHTSRRRGSAKRRNTQKRMEVGIGRVRATR